MKKEVTMNTKILKPEAEQKKLWHLISLLMALPIVIVLVVLILIGQGPVLFTVFLGAALVVFLLLTLYIPAFFSSLEYRIEENFLFLQKGVFWKRRITVPYQKITNIDMTQGPFERIYNIHQLHVQTAGASGQQGANAELIMVGIANAEEIKDLILGHVFSKRTEESAPAIVHEKAETEILQEILTELSAIRRALEKQ